MLPQINYYVSIALYAIAWISIGLTPSFQTLEQPHLISRGRLPMLKIEDAGSQETPTPLEVKTVASNSHIVKSKTGYQ